MSDKIVRYDKTHSALTGGLATLATRVSNLDLMKPDVEFEIQQMAVTAAEARDIAKDRRAREMAPFETPLKEVKARWAPLVDGFETCVTRLKNAAAIVLRRKREEEEKKRQEAEARLAAARAEEQRIEREAKQAASQTTLPTESHKEALTNLREARAALDALPPRGAPIGVKSESGTLSGRSVWRWETLDINQVPDAYVQRLVDPAKVDFAVKNGARVIPGLRIYEDTVMAVRKAKR